jgi:protein-tyrosine phosphatase
MTEFPTRSFDQVSILVVCTANVCRSPMAEAAFGALLPGVKVRSAGVFANPGQLVHAYSVAAVRAAGYGEIAGHRSQLVSPEMLREADLVFCADSSHRSALLARAPFSASKLRLLGELSGFDIEDPLGMGGDAFEHCLDRITVCIKDWEEPIWRFATGRFA